MTIIEQYISPSLSPEKRTAAESLAKISKLVIKEQAKLGRSGADVYFVDVEPREDGGPLGPHVLKIDKRTRAEEEQAKHISAQSTAIGRFMAHLVDTSSPVEGWAASLYSLAHGTLVNSRPLSYLIRERISWARQQIKKLCQIVTDWNADCCVQYQKPQALLLEILGHRFDGQNEILAVASRILGRNAEIALIRFQGDKLVLPNPVAYAMREELWGDVRVLAWPIGHVHGDLRGANIMCPWPGATHDWPTVIDFSLYRPDGLTLFDIAHLEFALLLEVMAPETNNIREQWLSLDQALCSSIEPSAQLPGGPIAAPIRDLVLPLRKVVTHQIQLHNQQDDFTSAFLLAGVAAGLSFLHELEDENECKAALLFAAHRLQALLPRLGLKALDAPRVHDVSWVSDEGAVLDEVMRRQFELLRDKISGALKDRKAILVLGPEINEWLDLPSDRSLARAAAEQHNRSIALTGAEDDPSCFDSLLLGVTPETIEKMKISVSDQLDLTEQQKQEIENKISPLVRVPWAAIVDWSFCTQGQQAMQKLIGTAQRIVRILPHDNPGRIDLRDTSGAPWLFLRGAQHESRTLVLGNRKWRLPNYSGRRRELLGRLYSTGTGDMVALFLGCSGEVLAKLYEELQTAFYNRLQAWAIASGIDQDPKAQSLQAEGLRLVPLSPDLFRHFVERQFPPLPIVTPIQDRYVLELSGVKIVEEKDESGAVVRTLQRAPRDGEQIVPVPIPLETFAALSEYLEILYRDIVVDKHPTGRVPGDFYRGYAITWKELALAYDVHRAKAKEMLEPTLLPDLDEHSPKRIRLLGEPGAGTSTLAARLAWDVYTKYHIPVAFIRRYGPDLRDAVLQFGGLFPRSFLLIAEDEYIMPDNADHLFEEFQARLVPIVMLLVGHTARAEKVKPPVAGKVQRHFTLSDELHKRTELRDLRAKLAPHLSPSRMLALQQLDDDSLFINLVTALEEQFIRLEKLIRDLLVGAREEAKELLALVAFCTRYAHQAAPVDFLSTATDLPKSSVHLYLEPFQERLILREEQEKGKPTYIRRHDLIGRQLLRELWGVGSEQGLLKQRIADKIRR